IAIASAIVGALSANAMNV
ncbi:MAG: smalltalk protein, partial [Bacteroides sp.]|nr:smalltalk protein [Bacteroides sp.]